MTEGQAKHEPPEAYTIAAVHFVSLVNAPDGSLVRGLSSKDGWEVWLDGSVVCVKKEDMGAAYPIYSVAHFIIEDLPKSTSPATVPEPVPAAEPVSTPVPVLEFKPRRGRPPKERK